MSTMTFMPMMIAAFIAELRFATKLMGAATRGYLLRSSDRHHVYVASERSVRSKSFGAD
jgi:hypothetical protein